MNNLLSRVFLFKVFSQNPDDNLFGLKFKTSASVLFMSNEADQIVQAVTHLKKRWLMSQPVGLVKLLVESL